MTILGVSAKYCHLTWTQGQHRPRQWGEGGEEKPSSSSDWSFSPADAVYFLHLVHSFIYWDGSALSVFLSTVGYTMCITHVPYCNWLKQDQFCLYVCENMCITIIVHSIKCLFAIFPNILLKYQCWMAISRSAIRSLGCAMWQKKCTFATDLIQAVKYSALRTAVSEVICTLQYV